jgi:hypothetical protein
MKKEKQVQNISQLVNVLNLCIDKNNCKLLELKDILESPIKNVKKYELTLHEYAFVEGCNTAYLNILDSIQTLHSNEVLTITLN